MVTAMYNLPMMFHNIVAVAIDHEINGLNAGWLVGRLMSPFSTKIGYIKKGLGWRFSFTSFVQ